MTTKTNDGEPRGDEGDPRSALGEDAWGSVELSADMDACEASVVELVDAIGPEGVAEVMAAWLNDTPGLLAEAERLVDGESQTTLNRVAHSIKGSSSIFALSAIAARAEALEALAARGEVGAQYKVIQDLSALVSATVPAFTRLRSRFVGS